MKGSITRKLFLALLAATVLVAIAVGVGMRLSFNAGFVDYVSEREARRLADLSLVLANAYRENGSWNFLQGNEALWRQLNAPHLPGRLLPSRADSSMPRPGDDQARPEPPSHDAGPRPPPPPREGNPARPSRDTGRWLPPREGASGSGPPPRPGGIDRRGGETSGLLDAAKQPVVGNTAVSSETMLQPVVVDERTVGWLAGTFVSGPLRDLDRRFQEKQRSAAWVIGGIALVLSASVALLLARPLLAPVKRLAAATHRLAAGDYATRVPPSGRDELGQLSEDFNRLAIALERAERMRRDFMADISHELRTPLAVLRGELEALQDGVRTLTPESLASLQAEVATLSKLIDDLYELSLADVGALAYRKESLAIVPVVERALGAFRERLVARRISIQMHFPDSESPVIEGDSARLTQLFNNVLENTIRYTDPDGFLRVTVARAGERVRLAFEDSAPGVPEALLPRLFERLFRAEGSRSRASGGAGLGLSLCQRIVEAHGGEIYARPSPLGGVSIEIVFPLARNVTG